MKFRASQLPVPKKAKFRWTTAHSAARSGGNEPNRWASQNLFPSSVQTFPRECHRIVLSTAQQSSPRRIYQIETLKSKFESGPTFTFRHLQMFARHFQSACHWLYLFSHHFYELLGEVARKWRAPVTRVENNREFSRLSRDLDLKYDAIDLIPSFWSDKHRFLLAQGSVVS